jgi:hypothetical protein
VLPVLGSNQNWTISNRPNGGLEIKNQQSNKCLFNQQAWGGGNGTSIVIQDCIPARRPALEDAVGRRSLRVPGSFRTSPS